MKTIKLEDGDFKEVYGYAPLNGEQVNRKLTPKMAIERARRALRNSRKFSNGEPIWRYERDAGYLILMNVKKHCYRLLLNAEAMGSPMTIADGEVFQFSVEEK